MKPSPHLSHDLTGPRGDIRDDLATTCHLSVLPSSRWMRVGLSIRAYILNIVHPAFSLNSYFTSNLHLSHCVVLHDMAEAVQFFLFILQISGVFSVFI